MNTVTMEVLDATDPEMCAEYERAFYQSFVRVTSNRLIRTLWCWDEQGERLATRIPYADQVVYVARDSEGRIETAIAANVALRQFQSDAFGFLPPADGAGCCEFLTFFTVRDHSLKSKLSLWEACFQDLLQRGFHTGYASTAARLLPVYRRIGGDVIAQAVVNGEERYFLRFSLERYWMRSTSTAKMVR